MILPAWFDHLGDIFFIKKFSSEHFVCLWKPVENLNEIPAADLYSQIYSSYTLANCLLNRYLTYYFLQINLKAGRNVIIWQATAITYGGKHDNREPVYIKSIEIQGLRWVLFHFGFL